MRTVNLCEILSLKVLRSQLLGQILDSEEINRIYVGSNFCSQYFMQIDFMGDVIGLCRKYSVSCTLVLPVFSEKDLSEAKKRINTWATTLNDFLDEITVNDLGMLQYISENYPDRKINLGRLFFKNYRDCRVQDYQMETLTPAILTNLPVITKLFTVHMVELDASHADICLDCIQDSEVKVAVHTPLCYLTTGNICKFASISRERKYKFRPNMACGLQCQKLYEIYHHLASKQVLYRIGRTVYFPNNAAELISLKAARIVYFPFFELTQKWEVI